MAGGFPGWLRECGSQSPVLSEALQELLELGDDLRVHRFHEGLEALLAQELLLRLELLVGELLQGHSVHRVLQGQLWDREDHIVSDNGQNSSPYTCLSKILHNLSHSNTLPLPPSLKRYPNSLIVEMFVK